MKITVVGVVLLVAAVSVGVLLLFALCENQERTPQTDTNVDCRQDESSQQDESLQDEISTFAQ
jgi:hypothetical protein